MALLKLFQIKDIKLFQNLDNTIYGTFKMGKEEIKKALELDCNIIDTATGYNNAKFIKECIDETNIKPIIITKFNQTDFDNDIKISVKKYLEELNYEPDIILMHTPLKSFKENCEGFRKLKELFSEKI